MSALVARRLGGSIAAKAPASAAAELAAAAASVAAAAGSRSSAPEGCGCAAEADGAGGSRSAGRAGQLVPLPPPSALPEPVASAAEAAPAALLLEGDAGGLAPKNDLTDKWLVSNFLVKSDGAGII